jgi:hypothetical protein
MSVRNFKVDELCLYRGKICRVLKVERNFYKGLEYMGIKDGTEYNPSLTLLPLYGVDNKPVKKPKEVVAISGSVEYVLDTVEQLKRDIERSQERIRLLELG